LNPDKLPALIDEATDALSLLDATALDGIADRLQALFSAGGTATTPELIARYRVFAGVLEATRENLGVVERVTGARCNVGAQCGR
jgi:hypothetical protein